MSDNDPTLDERPPGRPRAKRESEGGQGVLSVAVSGRLSDRTLRWLVGIILGLVSGGTVYSIGKTTSTANRIEKTDAVANQADRNAVATFDISNVRDQAQTQLIDTLLEALREVARGVKRCLPASERRELQERLSELEKRAAPLVQEIQKPLPTTPEAAASAAGQGPRETP